LQRPVSHRWPPLPLAINAGLRLEKRTETMTVGPRIVIGDAESPPPTARAREPLDLRTWALAGLFVLAAAFTLHAARDLFLPIVLAALFKVVLEPVVRFLGRAHLKPPLAAAVVVLALLGAIGAGVVMLLDPATEWLDRLPAALRRVESSIDDVRGRVAQVTKAAEQVERMTSVESDANAKVAATPAPSLPQMLFSGLWSFAGTALVVLVLLYFLLASGDLFLRKLVKVLPRLDDKKRAVEVARQIENDVSRHLLGMTVTNFALGAATAVALYFIGMPNPGLWGLVGALLNFIPYVGPLIGSAIVGGAAFLTFEEPSRVFLVVATFFLLTSLEGSLITPVLLGRHLALNPVAVFVAFALWSFLWGPIGGLLAMPLLIAFKALCDRIDRLTPIGEFLGR
jgi:predicted PurR-regulated permease PerM